MRTLRIAKHRDALTLATAWVGWTVFLAPSPTGSVAISSIAKNEVRERISLIAPSTDHPSDYGRRGSDVVFEDYPLAEAELSALQTGDRVEWPDPDGGTVELQVMRAESAHGRRHLRLAHDGLVSTFTQADGAFLGTLATRRHVYALEGNAQGSRLTRHALLDQRMNVHAPDYRPSPTH